VAYGDRYVMPVELENELKIMAQRQNVKFSEQKTANLRHELKACAAACGSDVQSESV
jgi:hypothetical protein